MSDMTIFEWYSYSHWGMFRLPLFTVPDGFVMGACDVDDEDIELELTANENSQPSRPR